MIYCVSEWSPSTARNVNKNNDKKGEEEQVATDIPLTQIYLKKIPKQSEEWKLKWMMMGVVWHADLLSWT